MCRKGLKCIFHSVDWTKNDPTERNIPCPYFNSFARLNSQYRSSNAQVFTLNTEESIIDREANNG